MRETRNKGYFQGGQLLYGYQLDGRKIIVNECEAEIVRYMYSEYAKGVYVKDILKDLAAKGITYKGRPFVRNSVYNILRNEKYSGVYKHGEEVIANMYPQIVPTELYEKVRAIVNKNKFGKRSVKADFLLRHNVICANGQHKILKAAELNVDQSRNPISDYGFPINLFFIINLQSISAFTCNKRAKCATLFAIVKHGLFS